MPFTVKFSSLHKLIGSLAVIQDVDCGESSFRTMNRAGTELFEKRGKTYSAVLI